MSPKIRGLVKVIVWKSVEKDIFCASNIVKLRLKLNSQDPNAVNVVENVLLFALLLTVSVVARVFDACENDARMTQQTKTPCRNCPCMPRICPTFHTFVIKHEGKDSCYGKNHAMQPKH